MSYRRNIVLWCVVLIILNLKWALCSLSGFYVDNGHEQTVMARPLFEDDQQKIETEILELLGLPERPKSLRSHPSLRKSAPKFLMDVYHRLFEEENEGNRTQRDVSDLDYLLSDADEQAIDQSDTIMTFLNKNHRVSEVRHERGRRLWFDASEVSPELSLMMAELRIYQDPLISKWGKTSKEFTITVYSIINAEGQKELETIASANTTANYQGWIEFNITDALNKWIMDKDSNKGLYLSAHSIDKPDHEVKLDNVGLVNTKGDDEYQPFLVGFFNGQQIIQPHKNNRTKRSAGSSSNGSTKKNKRQNKNVLTDWDATMNNTNKKSCSIKTLYISFQDLKWHDWIIAPAGFNAYYCTGECNFPLNGATNPTNHAIVQTLVHLGFPTKVPKPCCVPTKLGAISVLYYLDETNVNLKKYKNMVVKSCACH